MLLSFIFLLQINLIVRCQKMALLVFRRVGLCVGQNQMCHLCGWCLFLSVHSSTVGLLGLLVTEKHLCRAGLVALPFPHAQKPIESTKVQFSRSARLATNTMLLVIFIFFSMNTTLHFSSLTILNIMFLLVLQLGFQREYCSRQGLLALPPT